MEDLGDESLQIEGCMLGGFFKTIATVYWLNKLQLEMQLGSYVLIQITFIFYTAKNNTK